MHFISPAEIFGVDGIIVLIVVVLVVFGSTRIPRMARSLGSAQKEFKKGLDEGSSEDEPATTSTSQAAPPVAIANPPAPAQTTVQSPSDGTASPSS